LQGVDQDLMKLAFLILAHKNPTQVQRLVDYLLENDCAVFIHIDKKNFLEFQEFIEFNSERRQLHMYSKYKVYWGSFNQIKATFYLLEEALKLSQWDFVTLLSGQDVPIKGLYEFKEFLSSHRENSFFSYHPVPEPQKFEGNGGLDRVELFWFTDFNKRTGFFFNKLNVILHFIQKKTGILRKPARQLYGGSNWFTLNREMAQFAINYIKNNERYFKSFKNTRCADEIILQTILLNSQYKEAIINDCLRYIDWKTGPEFPKVFKVSDISELTTNNAYFARKFDEEVDKEVISILYNKI
jgi:hypothetical protein